MSPVDPNLLSIMCDRGVVTYIDAVGIHGFPGTWEVTIRGVAHYIMFRPNP
jgi:CDP-paratose 2-epimerase